MTQRLREETFDFPAPEELSFILALRLASIAAVRSDQFDTITSGQLRVQRVAIVGAICGKTSRRNARHVDGERSSPSRRMRSLAKALSRRAQVARWVSCLKAAVAVAGEGYCSGRSRQRTPVFITQRMPSVMRRSSRRGRPRHEFGSSEAEAPTRRIGEFHKQLL